MNKDGRATDNEENQLSETTSASHAPDAIEGEVAADDARSTATELDDGPAPESETETVEASEEPCAVEPTSDGKPVRKWHHYDLWVLRLFELLLAAAILLLFL